MKLSLWISGLMVASTLSAQAAAQKSPAQTGAFLEQYCTNCHDAETKKGNFELDSLSYDLSAAETFNHWQDVYDRIREQEMPPKKKTQPAQEERTAFLKTLHKDLADACSKKEAREGRVGGRHLTRSEFERTLQTVLGLYVPLQDYLPEDSTSEGFDTVAKGQQISANQMETYLAAIDHALDLAFFQALSPKDTWQKTYPWDQLRRDLSKSPNFARGTEGRPSHQDVVAWQTLRNSDFYGRMELTKVPEDGWYRVQVRAYAVNPPAGERIIASVFGGRHVSSAPERYLIGAIEADEKPADYEFISWMRAGDLLRVQVCNDSVPRQLAKRHPKNREAIEDLDGKGYPGIAVKSVQYERVYPGYSPEETRKILFGDLAVEPNGSAASGTGEPKHGESLITQSPPYRPVSKSPAQDFQKLILSFASRAYRRPVKAEEVAPFVRMAQAGVAAGASFRDALKTAYRGMLIAPDFFYFEEAPGPLSPHALAARMSYFFWGAPPDPELRALADSGKLKNPAVLNAQVERMLSHAYAKRFVHHFLDQWLKLRDINATDPDEKLYGEFDDLLKSAMLEETQEFFWDLLRRDLSVTRLVDSNYTFLNNRLAKHYGLGPLPKAGMQMVSLKLDDHRGGIVTQASVLKVTANGTTTSPVVRGVWMLERVMGTKVPPPPASVPAIEPDIRGAKSIREQLDKHRNQESCSVCHVKIDPPGFALENYDVIGGWRENYRVLAAKGVVRTGPSVDASYTLADGSKVRDLAEFKTILLQNPEQLARNLTRQLVTYATGAAPSFSDREKIESILAASKAKGYGVRTLIQEIVKSPIFTNK